MICAGCGAFLEEGQKYCPICGTQVPGMEEEPEAVAAVEEATEVAQAEVTFVEPAIPEQVAVAEIPVVEPVVEAIPVEDNMAQMEQTEILEASREVAKMIEANQKEQVFEVEKKVYSAKPVAVPGYMGLEILFAIPVIGMIFSAILGFASKNIHVRRFAKSIFIFQIIGLFLVVLAFAFIALYLDQMLKDPAFNMIFKGITSYF